ncbi:hypothetical protein OG225_03075 [Nocardia sp. NBC_01377]|uniref:hypothetical protein n=1 Tax=Nocardia sp. NBC_01377 TaxID=2903595 RepID=UPI00324592CD
MGFFIFAHTASGIMLVLLSLAAKEVRLARRIVNGVFGVAFLGYACYLAFFHDGGQAVMSLWVLILPIVLLVDFVRSIDLYSVSEDSLPAHERRRRQRRDRQPDVRQSSAPQPQPRRSAASRERRAARAAERAALRDQTTT